MLFFKRSAVMKRAAIKRSRRGASAVETALVLPLALLFLFGIFEYARFVMTLQVITNAAREGARYAVTHIEPVVIDGTMYGNSTGNVTTVINTALAGQKLTGQVVTIFASDALGNNKGSWNTAQVGDCVCVRITGNYVPVISTYLRLPSSFPVTVQSVMRAESN